jgi:uncharacterized membrane protein
MGDRDSPQRVTDPGACIVLPMLFPVVTFVVIAVPLVVIAFFAVRRSKAAGEHPVAETSEEQERIEEQFAQAEAYQEEWREEERKHPRDTII